MRICVCLNPVPDFGDEIRIDDNVIDFGNLIYKIDDNDLAAYKCALNLKNKTGAKITLISLYDPRYEKLLKRTWSLGADRCVWLKSKSDTLNATAKVMGEFLKVNKFDLALTGAFSKKFMTSSFTAITATCSQMDYLSEINEIDVKEDKILLKQSGYGHTENSIVTSAPVFISINSLDKSCGYPKAKQMYKNEKRSIDCIENLVSNVQFLQDGQRIYHDSLEFINGQVIEMSLDEATDYIVNLISEKDLLLK